MVDNNTSLTFSIRNRSGTYALLLGSGVSTEAEIPTGWGIVEDLIRQIADIQDASPAPDPFEWYEEEFEKEAEYDKLIEEIAPSREDRQSLLERYFEPTDEQREEGIKTPTEAHESIAWLIDEGYINIVITTNFDQLLEQALSERGVTPVVISSPSDAEGAAPLAHQDAVIIKLNGDYKDVNIKNITEELESYEPAIKGLLDTIFDKYGLIVCGWSGDWDIALREALLSCKSRRYSTYWAYHGELEDSAESLIAHRDGIPIQINGASKFFSGVKENVQALEGAESGAPLTRQIARQRTKRYLTREERKIDLADLLREETNRVVAQIDNEEEFPLYIELNDVNFDERMAEYENIVGTLVISTSTCAYWGPEVINSANNSMSAVVRRLGSFSAPSGTFKMAWRDLRMYPASFVMYGIGVAAVESENWDLVHHLLNETQVKAPDFADQRTASILNPWTVGSRVGDRGFGNRKLRNRLKRNLREFLNEFIANDERYENQFYKFEALTDLMLLDRIDKNRGISERIHIETQYWNGTIDNLQNELEAEGENWGPITAGMFDGSVDRAELLINELEDKSRMY